MSQECAGSPSPCPDQEPPYTDNLFDLFFFLAPERGKAVRQGSRAGLRRGAGSLLQGQREGRQPWMGPPVVLQGLLCQQQAGFQQRIAGDFGNDSGPGESSARVLAQHGSMWRADPELHRRVCEGGHLQHAWTYVFGCFWARV